MIVLLFEVKFYISCDLRVTLYQLPSQTCWLENSSEITHLALSHHPNNGTIKKSRILLFVNIKVKVRSGCVYDRLSLQCQICFRLSLDILAGLVRTSKWSFRIPSCADKFSNSLCTLFCVVKSI